MPNIKGYLDNIKQAMYGEEVRNSIHDGIEAINKEVVDTTGKQNKLENIFEDLIINAGNSNAEIVEAREGQKTLKENLNNNYLKTDQLDEQWENITIDNIQALHNTSKGGIATDISITGRTLVNLFNKKDSWGIGITDNGETVNHISTGESKYIQVAISKNLKTSTEYTLIIPIIENTDPNTVVMLTDSPNKAFESSILGKGIKGLLVVKLKTLNSLTSTPRIGLKFAGLNGTVIVSKDWMLLEGDYTSSPPSYFEGIKSFGEVNYVDGKFIGKNLFNGSWSKKAVDVITGVIGAASNYHFITDYIRVKSNAIYTEKTQNTFKSKASKYILFYDKNKGFLSSVPLNIALESNTFTTPTNTHYIIYRYFQDGGVVVDASSIILQLEEGTQGTDYEPYYEGGKIEILSHGKNILSFKHLSNNVSYIFRTSYNFSNDKLTLKSMQSDTYAYIGFKLPKLKRNTTYNIQRKYTTDIETVGAGKIRIYRNNDANQLVAETSKNDPLAFNTGNDYDNLYILFYSKTDSVNRNTVTFYDIQLEEENATLYEPYKDNKTEILIKEPLKSIGSISDKLLQDGTLSRELKQIVVNDETCNFSLWTREADYDCILIIPKEVKKKENYNGFLEGFPQIPNAIGGYWVNKDNTCVGFEKGTKFEDMKKAVIGKVFIYQLESPIIEQPNKQLNIRIIKDGYLSFTSLIKPGTIEFKLNSYIGSQLDVIGREVNKIENNLNEAEKEILKLNDNIGLINGGIDSISGEVGSINEKISSINGSINSINTKADYSEKQIKEALEGHGTLKNRINSPTWGSRIDISNLDLNGVIKTGIYTGQSMQNSHMPQGIWAYVEVVQHSDAWILQRVMPFGTNEIIQRQKVNNTWTNWQFIAGNMNLEKFDNGDTIVQRLPSGTIIISGWHHQSDSNGRGVYFPVTFPNKVISIVATGVYIAGHNRTGDSVTVFNVEKTGFSFNFGYGSTNTRVHWIAMGY